MVGVCPTGHAAPRGRAGLVDPDPLGKDRRREARRKREQRGVPPLTGAFDPVTLQSLLQPVGGQVMPGMPARDQPPVRPGPLRLLIAQRLRDRGEQFRERNLARPSRSVISPSGVVRMSVVLSATIRVVGLP